MRPNPVTLAIQVAAAFAVITAGLLAVPVVFAGRVLPGVTLGQVDLTGVDNHQLRGVLASYNHDLRQQTITVSLRDRQVSFALSELGVSLDQAGTVNQISDIDWLAILAGERSMNPQVSIDSAVLNAAVSSRFAQLISPPQNASLKLVSGRLQLVPALPGESVDLESFKRAVASRTRGSDWGRPVELEIVTASPSILDTEVTAAREYAEQLLRDGFKLAYADQSWDVKSFTIQRFLRFSPAADPGTPGNEVLGVEFDRPELISYLEKTIAPDVLQQAQDARFERQDDKVVQFSVPQEGRALNLERTADIIASAVAARGAAVELAVDVTKPNIQDLADIEAMGITSLLASGVSDYVGSPANRVHNIKEGTTRYHGLLLPPGEEISFNKYLGPVDGAHGFKPELVIKQNVTVPEFGGGLCQVSTTLFRAATNAGLKISQRRNHAYAVRYYGTPGFDATIYPPYTDLRFINNTPGYILVQANIDGTKLTFELWGTNDGRTVEVTGPNTYDHQPDGSVKATVTQRVEKDGKVIIDDTFYSRYRSPDLFPKVLSEQAPAASAVPAVQPASTNEPSTSSTTPAPAANSPAPSPAKAAPKAQPSSNKPAP